MGAREKQIETAYQLAKEIYAAAGVDTEAALKTLEKKPLSLHCWQGDDVAGFEGLALGDGGIQATGNYPGKARSPEELRADLDQALALLPGKHRVNVHALYAETGGKKVDRDQLGPEHFANWIAWAKARGLGLDFNPSFFSHRLAASGFTLSSADPAVAKFWLAHGQACRRIGAAMGRELGSTCVMNVWIPDGYKDTPADRAAPRERLNRALDALFAEKLPETQLLDAVESKLFGIGSESYVVGSHEFYMAYALRHNKLICLDCGHFHPTESIADKISSLAPVLPGILLHVSRGVRWDSDHVVLLNDDLQALAREVVAPAALNKVYIGLDYFDASINRIVAWVTGARATQKALLMALLEPRAAREAEARDDLSARLANLEEAKSLPWGAVYDYFCLSRNTAVGADYLAEAQRYERDVLSRRK